MSMKKYLIACGAWCLACLMYAQTNDPVIMKINGKDVLRSEFEYNFNKNNGENVVDKKTVDEYVDLFVNYKLKVEAALDARYDTLSSFQKEFKSYRDQQIRPHFTSPELEEQTVRKEYDRLSAMVGPTGLVNAAHIMVMMPQVISPEEQTKAKERIDSIYAALQQGADFATLAKQCSEDKSSAARGGDLNWLIKGQTVREFDDKAFAMKEGEVSEPIQSPFGYHIIYVKKKKQLETYEQLKKSLRAGLESRGLKEYVAKEMIDSLVKASDGMTVDELLTRKTEELCARDMDLKYLIQEYHDGLLLYEISVKEIWDKAANDKAGLAAYFKANKSKYKWDEPRYKGVVYHCKDENLSKEVRKLLKSVDASQWVDTLRATFNQDSVKQIRVEKSLFKKGDNAYVDHLVFKEKEAPEPFERYPYTAVYGKKLKKPTEWVDVRGDIVPDYQAACEEDFVRRLRDKYKVEIYKEVLNTVNKH